MANQLNQHEMSKINENNDSLGKTLNPDIEDRMLPKGVCKVPFWLSFFVVWTAYACTYLLRKPIGIMKSEYGEHMNLSNTRLGVLDLSMLLSYSIFQMVFGSMADKLGPRKTLSICLFGGGLSMFTFTFYHHYAALLVMLFICGAFQSFCWAACNTGLTKWFISDNQKRRKILGYFGTSPFIGGIVGTIIATEMLKLFTWRRIYTLPSIVNMIVAVVVHFGFQYPVDEEYKKRDDIMTEYTEEMTIDDTTVTEINKPLRYNNFFNVARVPGVIACSMAVSCLKIVRYGMYFWLPLYFEKSFNFSISLSSYLSIVFDIGAACGSFFSGFILKTFFRSSSLRGSAAMSALSSLTLAIFVLSSRYATGVLLKLLSVILIGLTGAMNGIPDILLCGTIPLELWPEKSAGAFIGFINGLGSIGATIEGPLIGFAADRYGWQGALILMIVFSALASAFCVQAEWRVKSAAVQEQPAYTV